LEGHSELQGKSIFELLHDLETIPLEIQIAVRNNGGGHANHSLFWPSLSPKGGGEPSGSLAELIQAAFGSYNDFKEQFSRVALMLFGSGWAWLCVNADGKALITTTANQDNPLSADLFPLLGLDLWEHAYYLNYENRRADYLEAWWNLVNWDNVAANYIDFKTQATVDEVASKVKGFGQKLKSGWDELVGSDD
jgi:Fe-Mn family superoxide dismutase